MTPVIPNKVPANRTHKHSEVADDVTDDGGKLTPTLNATIVEIAAVDRFFAGVVDSNMDIWHTVSRNRKTRPTPTEWRNEHSRKTNGATTQRGVVGNAKESGLRTVSVKLRKANVLAR